MVLQEGSSERGTGLKELHGQRGFAFFKNVFIVIPCGEGCKQPCGSWELNPDPLEER